jgi:streptogramin lyase
MKNLVISAALTMILWSVGSAFAGVSEPAALTGIVSSDAEGAMEGVLVSAKRIGGTITVTVVTDQQGRYAFPADRLAPGTYELSIRAIGYDAATPRMLVAVGQGKSLANIKLTKTHDLTAQMSDVDWLMSMPGTQAEKEWVFKSCVFCHTLTPVLKSTYDAAAWMKTLARMADYSGCSAINKPVLSPNPQHEMIGFQAGNEERARYLASINLSSRSKFDFELKALPRPHGADTRVIITEYDLPRPDAQPHDAAVDKDGIIWYCDFAEGIIGRLDPRTGEVKEWPDPFVKPGYPGGFQDLELDNEGNPWVGRHEYNGFAKFGQKAEKYLNWSIPAEEVSPRTRTTFLAVTPDEKVWIKDNVDHKAFRFDPATGQFAGFNQFPPEVTFGHGQSQHNIYGVKADSEGNEYGADIDAGNIARIDARTGQATYYPTPTPKSGPRRMHIDSKDRLWIGEYYGNNFAMFDTKTNQFKEWRHPIPWYGPYDVAPDKEGYLWTGGMASDLITRFNPKTGASRNYLLPRVGVNVRRVDVDNSGPRPIFWVGENHQAKIAKVEPLD